MCLENFHLPEVNEKNLINLGVGAFSVFFSYLGYNAYNNENYHGVGIAPFMIGVALLSRHLLFKENYFSAAPLGNNNQPQANIRLFDTFSTALETIYEEDRGLG